MPISLKSHLSNLNYLKIWRLFLVLSAFSILGVIIYEEVKTQVTYTFVPGRSGQFVYPVNNNLSGAPVITHEGEKLLLLNSGRVHFQIELTDIFDRLDIKIYYDSPLPYRLSIEGKTQRSTQFLDPQPLTLYPRLEGQAWPRQERALSSGYIFYLYTNPGRPDFFPDSEIFINRLTPEEIERRIFEEDSIWVVKSDQNTQFQSIWDEHNLGEIQYLLAPQGIEDYGFQLVQQLETGPMAKNYLVTLDETLEEEERCRGCKYSFDLVQKDFDPQAWTVIKQIEVTAFRPPVNWRRLFAR